MRRKTVWFPLLLVFAFLFMFCGCGVRPNGGREGILTLDESEFQKWLGHSADQETPISLADTLLIYHEEGSSINGVYWVDPGAPGDEVTIPGSIRPNELEMVVVVNLTPAQVKTELENRYREAELEVDLQIRNLRECILVTGEVENPGLYELREGKPLGQVLEEAGGFTNQADLNRVSVFIRKDGGGKRAFNFRKNREEGESFEVMPGDRIAVFRLINYSTN
jgi:protein involved in polysaccharide export with SLBB domain